jgi:general secretion pathway protein F
MPVYQYTGMNAAGKPQKGMLDAESPRALKEALKKKGIFLIEHVEGSKKQAISKGEGINREIDFGKLLGSRIPAVEIAMLTRQLATLQRAGVPLIESLNAVVEQVEREALKTVLSDVRQRVNEGSSLANALKEHPKVFSDLYVNMIRAGETSGNLDVVLERLTEFLESAAELRGKVTSALYYPIVMMVVGVGVMSFLFLYVIPKVTQIFEDQGQALPLITRILIGFTTFISRPLNLLLIFAALGAGFYGLQRWRATAAGRYRWDVWMLKLPILGKTIRMVAVARFAKTLSTLLASSVPLLSAMDIVKAILGNQRLVEVIEAVRTNVREGDSIAAPLKRSGEFPPLVTHMIAIGERTGRLEQMLDNVAVAYEKQVDNRLRGLTSLLEPLMIVVMGIVVAFIVFAILLPILKLGQGFS